MTMRRLRNTVRTALERYGYWCVHRSVLAFGVDYLLDIQRMAATHDLKIRCAFDIGARGGDTAAEFWAHFPTRKSIRSNLTRMPSPFSKKPNPGACIRIAWR